MPTAVRYFLINATAPMMVQEKLLRWIEYGVTGARWRQPAVAGECAVGMRDAAHLPAMVRDEGTFRADLLDRLAFDVVQLPPWRVARK